MGSHVWLGGGSASAEGHAQQELLLHELVHVKQHDEGRLSGVSGEVSHPTDPHEQEAERVARQAVGALPSLATSSDALPPGGTTNPTSASGPISRGVFDEIRAAGSEMTELGGDAFMALARRLSPTLARLIEEGPIPLLREQVLPSLEGWARGLFGDFDPASALTTLQDCLGAAFTLLDGALTGDPEDCKALATLVGAVREMARSLMEGPFVQELQRRYGELSAKLEKMIRVVAAPMFDAVKDFLGEAWGKVTGFVDMVKGWVADAQSWIGGAYDWLLEKLGLPPGSGAGGVLDWLMGHVNTLWTEFHERLGPFAGPIKALAAAAVALSPMGPLVALIAFAPQIIEIVSWLWAHKDDPDIIASAHEELGHTILPRLMDGISRLGDTLSAAHEWLGGMLQTVTSAVRAVVGAISELPIVKAARGFFETLSTMWDRAVQWVSETFGPAVTQARDVANRVMEWARPVIEVALSIGQALAVPALIPQILMGWAWRSLPDGENGCFKGPIIDLLLDAAIFFLGAMPVLPGLGVMWLLLRPGVLGFLKGVKAQALGVKITVANKLAKLISGSSMSLAIGFVKGLLTGLWEGLTDPFKLLWSLGTGMVSVVRWLWRRATGEGPTEKQGAKGETDAPGGAPSGASSATMGQAAQALRAPAETIAQNALPAATQAMSSGEGMTFDGLVQWISGLWSSAQAAIASAGDSLAQKLCGWFSSDGAEGQIGESIGWLVGTILFEVALNILTAGTWVTVGPTMRLLLRFLDWPGEVLGKMAKLLGKLGGALFGVAKKIGGMFTKADGPLKRVIDALFELGASLRRAADDLIGKVLGRNGDDMVERGVRETGEELGEQGARHVDDVPSDASKKAVAVQAAILSNVLEATGTPVEAIVLALRASFMPRHPWIRDFIAEPSRGGWQIFLLGSKIPVDRVEGDGSPNGPSAGEVGDDVLEGASETGEELGEHIPTSLTELLTTVGGDTSRLARLLEKGGDLPRLQRALATVGGDVTRLERILEHVDGVDEFHAMLGGLSGSSLDDLEVLLVRAGPGGAPPNTVGGSFRVQRAMDNLGVGPHSRAALEAEIDALRAIDDKILVGRPAVPTPQGALPIGEQRRMIGGHDPALLSDPRVGLISPVTTNADNTLSVKFDIELVPMNPSTGAAAVRSKPKNSTLAPRDWTARDILAAGDRTAATPMVQTRLADSATLHVATIDGVEWAVIRDASGRVTSSFPTGGATVPF